MKRFLDRAFAIRTPVGRLWAVLLGVLPILVVLAIWFAKTRGDIESRSSSTLLPQPEEVARDGWKLLTNQAQNVNVYRDIVASLQRVVLGFCVSIAVCVPLGIAMGTFSKIGALFRPIATFGGYVPVAAIVPLTMLFWGTDEKQKIYFLAIAGVFYLLPLVVKAVEQVDDVFLQTAYTLGAEKRHIVTKVMVPIASAEIFDAMRLAFSVGWTYIMLAEVIASNGGVGYLISVAQRRGPYERVFFMILVIVGIGFVIDKGLGWVSKQVFPWKYAR